MKKLTSARFILSMMAGLTFCWMAIAGKLPEDAVVAIIVMVFVSYFQRNDRKGGGTNV